MTTTINSTADVQPMIYRNGGNQPASIVFHEDGAHGYLQVPKNLINKLRIADKISSYSFHDDNNLYLEEDCDLSVFFQAIGIGYSVNETSEHRLLRVKFWEDCPRDYQNIARCRYFSRWEKSLIIECFEL